MPSPSVRPSLLLVVAAFLFLPSSAEQPQPNTDPITGYWDCCKPACSASDSPEHSTFETCDATGLVPEVRHTGDSVCHYNTSFMRSHVCPAASGSPTYSAECLMRVPVIQDNELYSYASYTEPKGATTKHQFCGSCRRLTLHVNNSGTSSAVRYAHIKYVNSKPYPARPGSHAMTGYRLLVPGSGVGDYPSGCACTFPEIYTPAICGTNGTQDQDTPNCKQFGGMQTAAGCEALQDSSAVTACKEVKLGLLNDGAYVRDHGHIMVLEDTPEDCSNFDAAMVNRTRH